MPEGAKIVVADDEAPTRNGVKSTLTAWFGEKVEVYTADNGLQALELTKSCKPDLLVTDIRMPGLTGIEVLERLRSDGFETVAILLTGYAEFEYAQKAVKLGAANYILKPVEREQLISSVAEGLALAERLRVARGAAEPDAAEDLPAAGHPHVRGALEYIRSHFDLSTLTVKEVAEHIHLSPSYFSAHFKDVTGSTFTEYVQRLRLRHAKKLLLETDLKIYEVADRSGFSHAKYFVKVFHENEGMTPKKYRRMHAAANRAAAVED